MAGDVATAQATARSVLAAELPRRWAHVQGVAAQAERLTATLKDEASAEALVAAAWVHDIGYAASIARLGFHPVDGAAFLEREGFSPLVVQLVAYHSGAVYEAKERGLTRDLEAVPAPPELLLDYLTAADMSTTPDGYLIDPSLRIAEILTRYEPDHPVHRAVVRSGPKLIEASQRILRLAEAAGNG